MMAIHFGGTMALAHVAFLNWQLAHQQQLAAIHGHYQHILHETEQAALRAHATAPHDAMAAAVISRMQLDRIGNRIDASVFPDFISKRAWADAVTTMTRLARPTQPGAALEVDHYFERMNTLLGFQQHMGGEPGPYLQRIRGIFERTSTGLGLLIVGGLCFVGGIATAIGGNGPLTALLVMIGLGFGAKCLLERSERARRLGEFHAAQAYVARFESFMSDPNGGGWLQAAWSRHRYLFETPPPELPQSSHSSAPIIQIERIEKQVQIVVIRCKYCSKLTPVDRATCEHCGAAGYGSSR